MNIVTLVKQVPDTESKIKVRPDSPEINSQHVTFVVNPYDEFAVEEALKIKEARGEGEVTVVCLGEEQATAAILTCLAMGADKSIHITGAAFQRSDSYATALALSKAVAVIIPFASFVATPIAIVAEPPLVGSVIDSYQALVITVLSGIWPKI